MQATKKFGDTKKGAGGNFLKKAADRHEWQKHRWKKYFPKQPPAKCAWLPTIWKKLTENSKKKKENYYVSQNLWHYIYKSPFNIPTNKIFEKSTLGYLANSVKNFHH